MRAFLLIFFASLCVPAGALAQISDIQAILQENRALIEESSRRSIEPAIAAIAESGLPSAQTVLQRWQAKELYQTPDDGLFYYGAALENGMIRLFRFSDGAQLGDFDSASLARINPNSGIRALIGSALVRFQLDDPDPQRRRDALASLQRNPAAEHLAPLRASLAGETDQEIRALKTRVAALLTLRYDPDTQARITAISSLGADISLDVRAALNPLLASELVVVEGEIPATANVARELVPGRGAFTVESAYQILVDNGLAAPRLTPEFLRAALEQNLSDGMVADVPSAALADPDARLKAYDGLAAAGLVPARLTDDMIGATIAQYSFFENYLEPSGAVTDAVTEALGAIEFRVGMNKALDLTLDALSLASILFLAAIGLAITFGVMGVINMAHGEFIMMGAYTGYVVQLFISNYTLSIIVALPAAFLVTFAAGVAMERLVIRWLYNRPLETLLATFGVSIALQQLAKNIFGTQARPLTAPGWLDGAWIVNDVLSISYIRIAIFGLALMLLAVFLFIMKRTRLGLETRAVTQNARMAASMGINTDRVNMLTFGLGSGIAGLAGVAIGLFAKVTSELGNDYIVQSFMTVVVGGVGNIWGALAGATMIGFFQKSVEWLNPSNTLAAQTYMIIFIIIFIQFRPRGIVALRGRAAGD